MIDAEQQAVIDFCNGFAQVFATLGYGKTLALSYCIANALKYYHFPHEDTLCLPFMNQLAWEMKNRVRSNVGEVFQNLFVGNTNRICIRLLFANSSSIDCGRA